MRLRFLQCEINLGERSLTRAGRRVQLQPKAFDVLVYLSQHSGQLIPTEELLETVWQGVRVTPASVSRAVHAARRAIGDDGDRQATIRTLRGRGFRFVAPVDEFAAADPLPAHVAYVGREALLAELRRNLETVVAQGGPRVLLLSGDAGIGKTRTAREIASWAEGVGFEVRDEQVHETDAPFASFDRLAAPGTPIHSVGAPRAELIAHIDAFRSFLETGDRERPLLIVLDDLHFGGPENFELLSGLVDPDSRARWAILATTRGTAKELSETLETHALEGLNLDDVSGFVQAHRRELSSELCRELHAHASGNPLHLRDLLALAGESPGGGLGANARSFEELVGDRLTALEPEVRGLVEWSAVAGEGMAAEVVGAAAGLSPSQLVTLRAPAEAAGFLRAPSEAITIERAPLHFRHDRVREATYASIPPLERARRHWRIAEWLERSHGDAIGPALERLAMHWSRAAPAVPNGQATRFCLRAGSIAEAADQLRRASRFYAEAVRLLDESTGQAPADLVAANLGLARTARAAGDWGTSVTSARSALEAMTDETPVESLGEASWLAAGPTMPYRPDRAADPNPMLRDALAKLPLDAPALRARLSMRLAASLSEPGTEEERAILRHQALSLARSLGQPDLLAEVLVEPYAAIGLALPPDELDAITDDLIDTGDLATEVRARLLRIGARIDRGDLTGIESELEALAPRIHGREEPFASYWIALVSCTVAMARGDFDLAESQCQAALSLGERIGLPLAYPHFSSQMTALRVFQGRGDEIRFLVEDHVASSGTPTTWAQTAWFFCETGEPEKARPIFERWMEAGLGDLGNDESWRWNAAPAARIAAALGEIRFAEPLLRQLSALPVDVLRRGYMVGYGPKEAYMGLLHALRQEEALATACFDRAHQLAARAGATGWCDAIVTWRSAV